MHDVAVARPSSPATYSQSVAAGGVALGRQALFALVLGALLLTGCDTAHSTKTGQVTAITPSSVCINPEDQKQEPYCLDVSDPALLTEIAEGECVEAVGSLDGQLVRMETLNRVCKLPRRNP